MTHFDDLPEGQTQYCAACEGYAKQLAEAKAEIERLKKAAGAIGSDAPRRLRLLADWMDQVDAILSYTNNTVQADLRKYADALTALAALIGDRKDGENGA